MIRTLIVDDDPDVARMHGFFVAALEGFAVAGVLERGGPVLSFLEENDVDLVLLDVHLPDMDGLQVLEDLRGSGYDAGVIMITAASERDTVRFAVGRGVDDYLVKPFTVTDFNRRLLAFRAAHGGGDSGAAPPLAQEDIDTMLGTRASGVSGAAGAAGPGRATGQDGAAGPGDAPGTRGTAAPSHSTAAPAQATAAGSPSWTSAATRTAPLPKGFSRPTLVLVCDALRAAAERGEGDLSAREVSAACGISRVSARRYLDMMAEHGLAELRPRYGAPGRPEHRYRWIGSA